jgi:putative ABC transport system substrate-binding protein
MNNRRKLLVALGAAAFSPRMALAQSKQPVLIGWLNGGSRQMDESSFAAFKEGLAALGWKEGPQFVIEERWANGRSERLLALAQELAAKKPAVIVAAPSTAVRPAAQAAPNTPVVQATGTSPVAVGLAASLARPGGMVTGVTNIIAEVSEKHLELLLAAAPKLRRIGFLVDSRGSNRAAYLEMARRAATGHSVEARFAEVDGPEEIEPAISRLAKEGAQALVVFASPALLVERRRIVKLALARRWPVMAWLREWADEGALLTYGIEPSANYRRAAYYVDRILKGATPGELPIEQPTKFELVVNLKTAKTLGLTIPQPFLMRADRVIE